MFPGGEIALRIESARKMVIGGRTIETVLHVVVAGPKYHNRLAGNLCHLRRFHDEVRLIASAKAAAHQRGMHDHFLGRQFCGLTDDLLRPLRGLRRHPRFRTVRPDMHRTVHGFHGGVSRKGEFVNGFSFFCSPGKSRSGITIVADHLARLGGIVKKLLPERPGGFRCGRAFVPGDL